MAKRSVHLTAQTERYITDRTMQAEKPSYSTHINAAVEQLSYLLIEAMPTLSEAEKVQLYNVYAGSNLDKIALPINIAADVLEHFGATVPTQTEPDAQSLINKVIDMSQTQQLALIDSARLFWSSGQ